MSNRGVRISSLFIFAIAASSHCYAGEWTRVSPTAISFVGQIDKDELSKFQKIYKPSDTTLIVNSTGGNMDAGLAIGKILIENKNLSVVVQVVCASSCANYLFLAGHTKIIDHGIVGFHGDWKAMVQSDNFKKEAVGIEPTLRAKLLAYHLQKVREETEFLLRAGAAQELFDKTQEENDNGLYDVYLPGPKIFDKYGIKNVVGTQDMEIVRSNPQLKVLYDNGPDENVVDPSAEITR